MKEPTKKCDLVMKGGITSGVVYPKLITELAKEYRFMNIGGTSAGAIAAGISAAAEFNRQNGNDTLGFDILDELPDDVGQNLEALFQPAPRHKRFFNFILALRKWSGSKIFVGLCQFILVLAGVVLVDLVVIGVIVLITDFLIFDLISVDLLYLALQILLVAVGIAAVLVLVAYLAFRKLKHTYFGFCSGRTERQDGQLGLTDWLNLWIERCAGRATDSSDLPERPLTFGMLKDKGITLRTVTTNLSQKTPVNLPKCDYLYMKKVDLHQLLPANIANHIENNQSAFRDDNNKNNIEDPKSEYVVIPRNDDMPVLLGVRLSLSFPILLAAMPFYKKDWTLRLSETEKNKLRVCWFSDGGISSNFPIHLFDSVFPSWPTFGVSLGEFHKDRHHPDPPSGPGQNRIYLPMGANEGTASPIGTIANLFGFLGAILNSAKDWQDLNQSRLPGYRERIVRIYLDSEKEGGLNLSMEPEVIAALTNLGEGAGTELLDNFDLNEHRWRRLLSAYAAIEECMEDIKLGFGDIGGKGMTQFLKDYQEGRSPDGSPRATSYPSGSEALQTTLLTRLNELNGIATGWDGNPIRATWRNNNGMPKPAASLKVTPSKLVS